MFALLKPEMRRCTDSLDPYLARVGFKIDSRHPIENWEETARKVYAPQMADPQFVSEFNVYLWMTKNLFGNSAVAYQVSRDANKEQNLRDLMEVKQRFRIDVSERLDGPIKMMINLDQVSTLQPIETGRRGIICIGNEPLQEGSFNGRWDYFFFKYIHTSDNSEAQEREENVLREMGIYDRRISDKQWKQMILTGTLTPLSGGRI
jgi:hypothetical protein